MALTELVFEYEGEPYGYTLANTSYGVLKAVLDMSGIKDQDADEPCVQRLVGTINGEPVEDAPVHIAWLCFFHAQAFLADALTKFNATSD